jgi:NitT/TauT family transport system ATP-binding protein
VKNGQPFIHLDRVSLIYQGRENETHALDHTTIDVHSGEFIAVVGPSGCGKSSLLKLVAGLHPATSGKVLVAGQEVTGPLKISGMAFQNATLLPWRRTIDNVLLPLEIVEPVCTEN